MTELIGKSHPRPDAAAKAMGRAHYIQDLSRPGMLYGKVKFSDHAHARIVGIDTSAAERLPGVRAVITAENTPEIRMGFLRDNPVLKKGRVRQFRDEIAAVAATDPAVAAAAIELITVEYEPLEAVFDPEEALLPGAPLVHEVDGRGRPVASNLLPLTYHHDTGDVEAGARGSAFVVEGTYSTPLIQQSCMGAAGCIAELDPAGNLTIWAKTQIPFLAQRDFVAALGAMGLEGRGCRVIVPAVGGSFGTGLDTHAYEYIAILLAWRTNSPVRIVYEREEEFANLSPRQSSQVRIRQGCDADGRLTFREVDVLQDNGAYASWGATYPTVMLLPATSLYRVPNVRFDARIVYTNNTYAQAMRGYGNPEVTWAIESNLDELALAASIDPLELRRINCNQPGEVTPMGLELGTCGLEECLDGVGARLSWTEKRGKQTNLRRGVGLASLLHVGGSGRIYRSDGGGLILKLDDFGNVNVSYGGVEMGQGLHSALTLTVAEALTISPERVHINPTDTGTCPWDVGTHASRGAFIACNAALLAAEEVKRKLFAQAAGLFEREVERNRSRAKQDAPPFDVAAAIAAAGAEAFDLQGGHIVLRDAPDSPVYRVELSRFLRAIHFRGRHGTMITAEAYYEPNSELPNWHRGYGNMSASYAFGTQGVEVEVDTDTGEVRILKLVCVHDVGKVLNRQTLEGQTYGGVVQGLGYALYEQILQHEGRIQNPSFTDYKIPTAGELDFPIELDFIETDDPAGPFGAKGVGEPGLVPTAPAIANAIYDAVGVRIFDLPITPEKVLAALRHKAGA